MRFLCAPPCLRRCLGSISGTNAAAVWQAKGAVVPRTVLWLLLIAMACTFLSQVGTGFDRPANVVGGCLSGGFALFAGVMLGRSYARGRSDSTDS